MKKLTAGMFDYIDFMHVNQTDFKLCVGQVRGAGASLLARNGGWFLANGTKLGWGDFSISDAVRTARLLMADDTFLVLREEDSQGVDQVAMGPAFFVEKRAVVKVTQNKIVLSSWGKWSEGDKTTMRDCLQIELKKNPGVSVDLEFENKYD